MAPSEFRSMKRITLGSATSWSRDRFEPAYDLLTIGNVQYVCFDAMSEVTMSAAQVSMMADPTLPGYDPYLPKRMAPILQECKKRGVKIITSSGWLDPVGAAKRVIALAEQLWDSLDPASVGPSDADAEMLRDRRAELASGSDPGEPWQHTIQELKKRGG